MKVKAVIFFLMLGFLQSCEDDSYIPKPQGFFRLDFPVHDFSKFEPNNCPFSFEIGALAQVEHVDSKNGQECWFNLTYPQLKSKVHFSYYSASESEVQILIEDARKLAMKHLVKADDFEESIVSDSVNRVFGTIYDFQGSAASNYQFYLTDNSSRFIRGALYFEVSPNADSLAPAEIYIEEELLHLVSTFEWK